MQILIDTNRDQPRLIRAAIAMVLTALDNGDALPLQVPANLVLSEGERLAQEQRVDLADTASNSPVVRGALDTAARAAFGGGNVQAAPPAPSIAVAAPLPTAPVPVPPVGGMPIPPASLPSAPPPAPVALAPSIPAAPSTLANGVEVDIDGLPWDARIHAATKTKIASHQWKRKKGVDATILAAVTAELKQTMAIPAPSAVLPAAPQPPAPPAPPAGAAPVEPITNFAQFMAWIASLIQAGKWSHEKTAQALGALGIPSPVALTSRPELIPSAVATIQAML